MRYKKITIFLLIITILLTQVSILGASSLNDLEDQQQNLKDQITEKKDEINNLNVTLDKSYRELQELQDDIIGLEGNIDELKGQIENKNAEISTTKEDLVIAKNEEEQQYISLKSRIKYMYENSRLKYVQLLFESDSIADFYKKYEYIKAIMDYDKKIFGELEQTRIEIQEFEAKLQGELTELETLNEEFTVKLDDLEGTRQLRQSAVAKLETQKKTLEDIQQSLEKESNAVAQLIEQKRMELIYEGGLFSWPVPGHYRLSSPFGWRKDPFTGEDWYHYGIDIPAATGTTVEAAASGVVIMAKWYGGYGNAVIIDHGSGMATLYGHNSRLVVSEGEHVERGQKIAEIGSTGRSTGPHSHFEVRINGNCKNPMEYLEK